MSATAKTQKTSNLCRSFGKAAAFANKLWVIMLLSALLGAAIFISIYGVKILDPTYEDWLFEGSDLTQHYIGWTFFRRSGWHFPLGLIDNILGDIKISIMYTDSVPLFAIFFKLLSPILPETFQYFGIMGLITFMLNGSLSSLLIYRFNKNGVFCVLGSMLYIVCPVILRRLYDHEALASHYIFFLGLILWLYQNREWKKKWQNYIMPPLLWGALGAFAVNIHLYFLPMIYCCMLGCIITDVFKYKKRLRPLLCFISLTLMALLFMWLIGAFYTKNDTIADGLGVYSANIDTYWNPLYDEGSEFIEPIPVSNGQYEGYAYIGCGIMLGLYIAFIVLLNHIFSSKDSFTKTAKSIFRRRKIWLVAGTVVFCVSFFYALSPSCFFNERKIYDIFYPAFLVRLMSMFRATGRYAWVGMYFIFTIVIYCLSRMRRKTLMVLAIAACVGLQYHDMQGLIRTRRKYKTDQVYTYPYLVDPRWEQLAESCDKFVGLSYDQPLPYIYDFSIFAYKHDMSINHFHIARPPLDDMIKQYDETIERLSNGDADEKSLYVFLPEEKIPEVEGSHIYELDGFHVVKFPNQYDPLSK